MGANQQQIVATLVRASIIVCFTGLTVERALDGWVLDHGPDGYEVELANGERAICPGGKLGMLAVASETDRIVGIVWTNRDRELADREALAAVVLAKATNSR